ncbi:MAG: DUF4423 domain-containing protein [Pseudobdellovibrionaceae bacterium]
MKRLPKTAEIMDFLKASQLVNENNGKFTMGTQSTHLESSSPHIHKHHSNWRIRAIQASENLSDEELMYTVNVSLSKADFIVLREELVTLIKSFLKKVHDSPAEEIACLNLDWFWIRQ